MLILTQFSREYIWHILVCRYVGVNEYSSSMQISTVVIINVNVFNSSFDDSHDDKRESTLIVAVVWQRWDVILRTVNIVLQLEKPFRIARGLRGGDERGHEG